jgi:hypothetical protein
MSEQAPTKEQLTQEWVTNVTTQAVDDDFCSVGGPPRPIPIPEEEWMRRLRARFIERAGDGADAVADCASYAEWCDGFEDDPESAADEEMSYWDTP